MTLTEEELRRLAEHNLGVPAPLHAYQWEGVSFLFRSEGALLADEMGLGKTVQATVAIALLMEATSDIERILIVAPASLTLNWMKELASWAPGLVARRVEGNQSDRTALYMLPIPVLVASYEQIRMDGFDRIPHDAFDLVVLDEAQRIKDRNSATSLACRLLPRNRSWALSATPLENKLEDVATVLAFLHPNLEWKSTRYEIDRRLELSMLRRRKSEVRSQLPPAIVQDIQLELGIEQRVRYNELWTNRRSYIYDRTESERSAILGLITMLKGICNQDELSGASSKLEALEAILESAGESARLIVFSQFVKTLEWLSARLTVEHKLLIGSTDMQAREELMEEFRCGRTPRALLISLRAGGVGLNLGEATHVVLFDRWWNPAVENQAVYRAHRFDRSDPLHVVRFIIRESIEERIADILDKKGELFGDVVENASFTRRGFRRSELLRILDLPAGPEDGDSLTNIEDNRWQRS